MALVHWNVHVGGTTLESAMKLALHQVTRGAPTPVFLHVAMICPEVEGKVGYFIGKFLVTSPGHLISMQLAF